MIYNKDEKTGELYHHGIKGQRWGVRRYQNEDGSYTAEGKARRIQSYGGNNLDSPISRALWEKQKQTGQPISEIRKNFNYDDDYIINKNTIYERTTNVPNEKFNKRMYATSSSSASDYAEALFQDVKTKNVYYNTLETQRDVLVAGKNTINDILKDVGGSNAKKIAKAIKIGDTKKKGLLKKTSYVDFLYKDDYKIADKFIKELKDRGYDAIPDPMDSGIGVGYDDDSIIFVNDVLKRIKQEKY